MSGPDVAAARVTQRPAPALADLAAFFESRAADVDAGRAGVREGLAELGRQGLAEADLGQSIEIVRSVARSDLATAFSAWAHRMVIDYIRLSPKDSPARAHLAALATADTLGATALAAGTAHVLAGVPLPITFRVDGDEVVLDGRIPWASNLLPPFLVVTAAAHVDDPGRSIVVALPDALAGVEPAPFPELLALGATGSTTVRLGEVRVPRSLVISEDLHAFSRTILGRFLLLQAAFCAGLAERSLEEAAGNLGAMGEALSGQLELLTEEAGELRTRLGRLAADVMAERDVPTNDLLGLRLRSSELASVAVHLELATVGGRGYLRHSPTARRVREAAFLPVQAPTEVLLRWLLSRSA